MKILIISRGIPTKKNPQNGCFELDQAKALKAYGHDVVILAINGYIGKEWKKFGLTNLKKDGIGYYEFFGIPTAPLRRIISRNFALKIDGLISLYVFKHIIREFGLPDIIHSHYVHEMVIGIKIKKKYNLPLIGTEHWSEVVRNPLPKKVKNLIECTYPKLDQLITVSEFLHDTIEKRLGFKSIVCPNVLGYEFLKPLPPKKNNDKITFISCGSLIERKGYNYLIEGASKLNLPKNKWQIKIIGSGPLRENLQELINHYNLQDNIILLGTLDKYKIITELDSSNVFILSSISETFGVVVIEALSRGLPCIVTQCGGTEGLITKETGIYIPIKDSFALKNSIEEIYSKYLSFDAAKIREECLTRFSPNSIATKLTDIYKETLKNQNYE